MFQHETFRLRAAAIASVRMMSVLAVTLFSLTSLAAPETTAQPLTKVSVALDWYPNANHAGLFLAEARGYFAEEGLEVELYTPADPTVVLQTVGAGRDTFGISYQTDVLLARAEQVPVVSVAALVQRPLLGVMSLRERTITRPRDLLGKTVGYPGIPSQEAFLATMLENDGASLDDVELVNVGFDLVPAVVSGQVDAVMGAYWTHETLLAERAGHAVDFLNVEDWGVPRYYELVLVSSEATISSDPDTVRAFLRAMQRGYADATNEPAAALDALAAASPELDREVESEGLVLLAPAWTDGVSAIGVQSSEQWESYADWMVDHALIPDTLSVADAYTTDLITGSAATAIATPNA